MIVLGDAYMRLEEAEVIADNIRASLDQVIGAASGKISIDYSNDNLSNANLPDTFNVGKNNYSLSRQYDHKLIGEILIKTPVPGMASGIGEMPRFRSELGAFLGASASLNGTVLNGGFGKNQTDPGFSGGIEANIRFGLGIDGVLNEAGDGLVFIQAGRKEDATSSNTFADEGITVPAGTITAAIPARSSYTIRVRLPFYLIPGDLIIAAPLLLFSPETYTKMAITSGNGGLIPWQSGMATSFGRFQFILGREMGVTFYGLQTPKDVLLIPTSTTSAQLLEYKSTQFDFPFLEYRPFRTFSMDQSSSLIVQFTAGFDIPHGSNVILPAGDTHQELKTVWYVGSRIVFDWRHYFK